MNAINISCYTSTTMSVLTRDEIIKRIKSGEIIIDPFDESSVGPASVDLHLDNQFRVFEKRTEPYPLDENASYEDITKILPPQDEFILQPDQTIHAITIEKLMLPTNLCGWLEGKSSLGRLGLAIHITAGFIHPGVVNKQVLEINNMSPVPLILHKGIAICQVIFEETIGNAKYEGKFQGQEKP